MLVSDDEVGRVVVVECAYCDTLLVELTEILLYGQLKIDFVAQGTTQASVIEFSAASGELYREALWDILERVKVGATNVRSDRQAAVPAIEMRPIVFRNAVPRILAEGHPPVAALQWPAVYGSYGRKLAPASALLTTDRELVLISERRAWMGWPRQAKYGYIATYVPLARLAGFDFRRHERYSTLELGLHAIHGGEMLQILFTPEREQQVAQLVESAIWSFAEPLSIRSAS